MDPELIPIDDAELKALTAALQATSYHEHLARYVRDRIAYLLDVETNEPYLIMKRRGQVEELSHLLRPAFTQTLALLGLRARAERDAATLRTVESPPPPREWWVDVASEHPVP